MPAGHLFNTLALFCREELAPLPRGSSVVSRDDGDFHYNSYPFMARPRLAWQSRPVPLYLDEGAKLARDEASSAKLGS